MTKPTLDPDTFFSKIQTLVHDFVMKGTASIDTSYQSMNDKLRRGISWNISYKWKDAKGGGSMSGFYPHTLRGLIPENDKTLRGRDEPLSDLNKYSFDWIDEDNAMLAACGPYGHSVSISFKKNLYVVEHLVKENIKKTFERETWASVLDECILNALMFGDLSFYEFQNLSDQNQKRVLSVLNIHPVHNEETVLMHHRDMTDKLSGLVSEKPLSPARKM